MTKPVAIVTGGSRGVGAEVSKLLASKGWNIAITCSSSIEAANELFNNLKNNSSNYYKTRILKTKQISSRSSFNHFAFHLSNPLNVLFRDIFLKYFSKNKNFLENYLGKIYNN